MNMETPRPEDPAPATAEPVKGDAAAPPSPPGGANSINGTPWPPTAPPGAAYHAAHLPAAADAQPEPTPTEPEWPAPEPLTRSAASRRQQILTGVAVVAVIGALGFPLGWLWSSVAPWLPAQVSGGQLLYADPEGEQLAGGESWFILLSIGAGILFAVVAWFALRRFRGSVMVAALGIGSIVTGWIAWWYGHNIGLNHALDLARHAKDGAIIKIPPSLRIKQPGKVAFWHHLPYLGGDILYVAVAALAVYVAFVGFSASPSLHLRRTAPQTPPPMGPQAF
jgi:hypothetical protein